VALTRRQPLPAALRLLAIYSAIVFVEGLLMGYVSTLNIRNLWMIQLFAPFEATLFLLMFARWQVRETSRLTVLVSIPLFLLAWTVLMLTVEPFNDFSQYVKPVEFILLTMVAAFTLVTRSQHLTGSPMRQPWFWVGTGSLIYFGTAVALNPVSAALQVSHKHLILAAFETHAALDIFCYLLFTRAMLCQPPIRSGSSSPQRSLASS
jgi:hypothetical protein